MECYDALKLIFGSYLFNDEIDVSNNQILWNYFALNIISLDFLTSES